ncbi:MAG: hypothetical protein NW214_09010 [Pseudanabaenaceae cyanobacterium bins.39]|nr:hypothetical protein [Pseudanabaenaceae cyanobacterium bins.39]
MLKTKPRKNRKRCEATLSIFSCGSADQQSLNNQKCVKNPAIAYTNIQIFTIIAIECQTIPISMSEVLDSTILKISI